MSSMEMLHKFYVYMGDLSVALLLLNVVLYFLKYNVFSEPFRRLSYFLVWGLLIELLARIVSYSGNNNLPLLHLYTLGEFILLSWFYRSMLIKPLLFRDKFWYFIVIGIVLIILNSIFLQNIFGFNTIAKTAVQVTIISFAVLFFYHLTENRTFSQRDDKSLRLINSAIIVYYSGSLFIFMCSQVSFDYSGLYEFFWAFNAMLNLIFQVLILWGIWKMVLQKTPSL